MTTQAGAVVVAIANQKGGVGKTTTAINLGAELATRGVSTLLIDLDPQANSTAGLGLSKHGGATIYDVLINQEPMAGVVVDTVQPGLSLVPSGPDLAGAEVELVPAMAREHRLQRALDPVAEQRGEVAAAEGRPLREAQREVGGVRVGPGVALSQDACLIGVEHGEALALVVDHALVAQLRQAGVHRLARDADALRRFRENHPHPTGDGTRNRGASATLSDAQLVIAREYGFEECDFAV